MWPVADRPATFISNELDRYNGGATLTASSLHQMPLQKGPKRRGDDIGWLGRVDKARERDSPDTE